jgi:predicted DCC family thiol-disulfide oxidoreductase YuxK
MTNERLPFILIYDGECIFCRSCAKAFRLKEGVGEFRLINARDDGPLVQQVKNMGYDLNSGIMIIYNQHYYHGEKAVMMLAMLTSRSTFFNRLLAYFFKSKIMVTLAYPMLTFFRRVLLKVQAIKPIAAANNVSMDAIIKEQVSAKVPGFLLQRYSQSMVLKGKMIIRFSWLVRIGLPIMKVLRLLSGDEGEDISVSVWIEPLEKGPGISMKRIFYFDSGEAIFCSQITHHKRCYFLEKAGRGLTWKFSMHYVKDTLFLKHKSYGFLCRKQFIPLPGLAFVLGKTDGYEKYVQPNALEMSITVKHWFVKNLLTYQGRFRCED